VSGICDEIQEKIVAFVKGKDLKGVFQNYANTYGYIDNNQMKTFLHDAGVSWGCRYPGKVIGWMDQNNDEKLTYEEIVQRLAKQPNFFGVLIQNANTH